MDWLRQGIVRAVVDDRIVAEYHEVLRRPRFGFPAAEIALVLESILFHAVYPDLLPNCLAGTLPDADDLPFAECAVAARCPLVTGNVRHFPAAILRQPIITPAEFVKITMPSLS